MLVIPDAGGRRLLNNLLDCIDVWIHLYVNPATLGPDTTSADLTEASWVGYAPQHITTWIDAETVNHVATTFSDPALWIYGAQPGPTTVYGYWMADMGGTLLMWVEARPQGPVTLSLPTDQIEVFPSLTLQNFVPC